MVDGFSPHFKLEIFSEHWRGAPVNQLARMLARWGDTIISGVRRDGCWTPPSLSMEGWGRQQKQTRRIACFRSVLYYHCCSTSTKTIYVSHPRINQWRKPWVHSHITTEQTVFKRIQTRQKLLHFIYGAKRPNDR